MSYNFQYLARAAGAFSNEASSKYLVETPDGVLYLIYIDVNVDVSFIKSMDGGRSWSSPTTIFEGSTTALSIWYDRWSGINAGLIHCAYSDSGTDDTFYRSIDTESSDALGTQTTIFAGASTAANGHTSITRARGGNLYCKTVIDAGAEGGFFRSTDVGATWESRTVDEPIATQDRMILLPGFAADNQDIIAFFWDASANEISRKLYDDSGNSWAESSIATSMVESTVIGRMTFSATVDLANSQLILVAWSGENTVNAELRCWTVTESAITEVTNVVSDSGGNQSLCAVGIDLTTGHWIVGYAGKSDGSEILSTAKIYYKISTDQGNTWGAETAFADILCDAAGAFFGIPRIYKAARFCIVSSNSVLLLTKLSSPRASFQLGL